MLLSLYGSLALPANPLVFGLRSKVEVFRVPKAFYGSEIEAVWSLITQ